MLPPLNLWFWSGGFLLNSSILSCNWLVCSLTSFFLFYNVPFCQQAYNYRWSDCNRLFYLFAHVVLHLDRFLFLLPDLFSSPYSYIWMISIIIFWTICSLFIIIIQFQHANKCFLFFVYKILLSIYAQIYNSSPTYRGRRILVIFC